jgi:hypothetical protein
VRAAVEGQRTIYRKIQQRMENPAQDSMAAVELLLEHCCGAQTCVGAGR